MPANSIGEHLILTTCGESHGEALLGILDGVPSGICIDMDAINREMARRRPGQSAISTPRDEKDEVRIISGVFEGKTTGTSIGMMIKNADQHSSDYSEIASKFRPAHADFTYTSKYGLRDYRGGGRSSARETAIRVAAGAIARQVLPEGVDIKAYVSSVGGVSLDTDYTRYDLNKIESNELRCPDAVKADAMKALIMEARSNGDSIGGVVTCVIKGVPVGLGEPIFDRLEARLAAAMMSIPASKGFEVGSGFAASCMRGSEHNDAFVEGGRTSTNHSGGIQGGISNGMDIYFRVAFKSVATIMKEQETIDIDGHSTTLRARGRHDPCVVPRAVPIVEAMAALTLADFYLIDRMTRIKK